MSIFPVRSLEECHRMMTSPGTPWEMEEKEIRGNRLRVYKNVWPSMRFMWQTTKAFGPREYIIYEGERWTFAQAHARVDSLAALFYHKYGVRKGDRVSICARNSPDWVFAQWAVVLLGAVTSAVNGWLPMDALLHCTTITTPRLVILDEERAKNLADKVSELDQVGGTRNIVVLRSRNVPQGMLSLDAEREAWEKSGSKDIPEVEVGPEDIATVFFTSGTTGMPKGVVGTHRNYISNIVNSMISGGRAFLRRGEEIPAPDPEAPQKALLLGTPLFHAVGNHSSLGLCTAAGFRIVMIYKWDLKQAIKLIIDEKISNAGGITYQAMEIAEGLKAAGHTLESVSYGGSPSSAKLPGDIQKRLGKQVAPACGYGATESSSMATGVAGEDYILRPTCAGLPTFVTDLKIIDDQGKELPTGEVGEVLIRGPGIVVGYWRAPKATAETFDKDGWYHSGDLGHVDHEGFLYISDRAKDIIIRGGENIASGAVESAIAECPSVFDVAVVAVPDRKLGELVSAAVVLRPEHVGKTKPQDVMDFAARSLPRHCVPVLVEFVTEIPRNTVGKPEKKLLRETMAKIWVEGAGRESAKL